MRRIRLFTSAFAEADQGRRAEYRECLARNLAATQLDEICVLVEGNVDLPVSPRLAQRAIAARPRYADYLSWIREVAGPDDVSIIANADIYFDDLAGVLRSWRIPERTVFALARWDVLADSSIVLNDRNDSQDAWVFAGVPHPFHADFPVGVPRCDNRIVKELEIAGFTVLNPAYTVRALHLHRGARGEYPVGHSPGFVEGPYGYVWPHNLASLPRSLWHEARHRGSRVAWRLDRRFWSRTLRLRWARQALRRLIAPARSS